MIEFRMYHKLMSQVPTPLHERAVLQYRVLFTPVKIASGDIVLWPVEKPEWQDVPTVQEGK